MLLHVLRLRMEPGKARLWQHVHSHSDIHIATFNISAINVDSDTIRLIIAIWGAACCLFGLMYGGYWRSEIRKKFKLPGNSFCCGYLLVTDFMQWLFCSCCSLAQEFRTENFYDTEEDGFYRRVTDEEGHQVLIPLPHEDNLMNLDSIRSFSSPSKLEGINTDSPMEMLSITLGRASTYSKVQAMRPPVQPVMQTDNE